MVCLVVFAIRRRRSLLSTSAKQGKGGGDPDRLQRFGLDVAVGAGAIAAVDGAVLLSAGTLSGPLYPLTYLVLLGVAITSRPAAALIVAMLGAGVESMLINNSHVSTAEWLSHLVWAFGFCLLGSFVLYAERRRLRDRASKELTRELSRLREEARSFRLLNAGEKRAAGDDRLAQSSVEEIHQSVHYALDLLRKSLSLHTAVLLWRNETGTHYRISELSTASDQVRDSMIPIGEGILSSAHLEPAVTNFSDLRPTIRVPYYEGPCPVQSLASIPIFDRARKQFLGMLVIDRVERAFATEELELAHKASIHCLRTIENQRAFLHLDRAKLEQGKLYRATQNLATAGQSEKTVIEAGVRSAREMASFNLAAVTIFDAPKRTHQVVAALGDDPAFEELVGASFQSNSGLVSMVVQNHFPLPYRGEFDPDHQVVLSKRYPFPRVGSLLVLPLMLGKSPLGTLILGSNKKSAFGDSVRATLDVFASHFAVSLANARMMQKLEMLATTDSMTGHLNKRAMMDAAVQKIEAAARFKRKLSVLVTDIDFFKKVNDTYGHDVGDTVIKGLGKVLLRQKRNTDVVARFGGEEFVILCEQTDETGAMLLAERIREDLEQEMFESSLGKFNVTCSIGVATMPAAGTDWDALFKAADDALYASKHGGRNRVSLFRARASERIPAGNAQTNVHSTVSSKRKS
jgi:two-component system, cell cycle response regulator